MLRRLCQIFSQASHPFYVTACYALLDGKAGRVRFALAAHPAPILDVAAGLLVV